LDKDQEISLAELEQYAVKEVQRYARNQLAVAQTPERRGEARGLLTLASAASVAPLPTVIEEFKPGQVNENSIGMQLVAIPPGEFRQGSIPAEAEHVKRIDANFPKQYADAEMPQHPVRITKPFLLGMHEVTKGQFARFVQEQHYQTEAERDGAGGTGYNPQGQVPGTHAQFTWRNTGYPYADNQPVVNVSFNDAVAFCQWLSGKERRAYTLPTEAQWEYACRAGTQTLYSHGDDPEVLAFVGNVADGTAKAVFKSWNTISAMDRYTYSAPVGQYRANAFGLYDMHGNVSEWCSDWFVRGYPSSLLITDPTGPATGKQRVVRGGNFEISAGHCRSANRSGRAATGRSASLGFRVAILP
jgi:formylglycine-generating enzyme required for sulfatase activity